jgi:chromatin assembly factor 1 subunit B
MHIYSISTKPGGVFEAHAVGKNTRMPHHQRRSRVRSHSRTPSVHGGGRPRLYRRESITSASEAECSSVFALDLTEDSMSVSGTGNGNGKDSVPLTPATSAASLGGGNSTPSFMFPPPPIEASSRRSSFSSNAPGSPSPFVHNNHGGGGSRYGRSPSPMPPLPAIRSVQSPAAATSTALWTNVKLYGDESYTNFFRRLTFSPDGGLLLTPAGQFEDPSIFPGATKHDDATPTRGRKGHPSETSTNTSSGSSGPTSSVYIYSRANFTRPPIAQLPGHKKASVAVRFSPVLYELRPGVALPAETKKERDAGTPSATLEKGVNGNIPVDVNGPLSASDQSQAPSAVSTTPSSAPLRSGASSLATPQRTPGQSTVATPAPRPAVSTADMGHAVEMSPMLSPVDLRPPTPAASKPASPSLLLHTPSNSQSQSQSQSQHGHTPSQSHSNQGSVAPPQTNSVFALPYRLLFAVLTMDTVAIYDTQQATPLCLLTKLHYDEFTDLTWYGNIIMTWHSCLQVSFLGLPMGSVWSSHPEMVTAR